MKILNSIFNTMIETAHAQGMEPSCYAPQMWSPVQKSPIETCMQAVNNSSFLKIVTLVLAPVSAIALSVINAKNLLKRSDFSVHYSIYKSFSRVIILSLVFILFPLGLFSVFVSDFSILPFLYVSCLLFLVICVSTGITYLFFALKNKKFLWLAFANMLVIPGFAIFLWLFFLDVIPAFNKYLPKDAIEFKKEQLRKRLVKDGKIPENVNPNT